MSDFIHLSSKAPWVNWELLHHLAVLVCIVAESRTVSLFSLSLCLHLTRFLLYKHALCSVWFRDDKACQSQTVSHHWCISNPGLSSVFSLLQLSLYRLLRDESHRRTFEELHNSYLGQWCMVTLVVMWCYLMWKLTARTEKKEKCKEKRKYIRGVDAERKTQNKQSCLLLG